MAFHVVSLIETLKRKPESWLGSAVTIAYQIDLIIEVALGNQSYQNTPENRAMTVQYKK